MSAKIFQGDCRLVMASMPDASVDSIVTDPPYELGFMGKKWDSTGVANDIETWRQALRVLKPGGHLIAFSGTRTYHRMVCSIEDAGFEIRDQIGWLYGSGFPKSLDVSKAIDGKLATGRSDSKAIRDVNETRPGEATVRSSGTNGHRGFVGTADAGPSVKRDTPATAAAADWQGWGTALKPAWEPIVVARKPLIGTVAANVLEHGTGALNIDGCCIDGGQRPAREKAEGPNTDGTTVYGAGLSPGCRAVADTTIGRWPANIIHDGSDDVLAAFPQASGAVAPVRGTEPSGKTSGVLGEFAGRAASDRRDGGGSAARFFYTAKASAHDRNDGLQRVSGADKSSHPTVKPTDLMRYLCRLVTPPGGVVLDPFMGSGSTLKAAELEGFDAIGIELDEAYIEIAKRRVASDMPLFADVSCD